MATPGEISRRGPLKPARALVLYVVYVAVFVLGGGVGAGVTGWIAYRLAQRVMEG